MPHKIKCQSNILSTDSQCTHPAEWVRNKLVRFRDHRAPEAPWIRLRIKLCTYHMMRWYGSSLVFNRIENGTSEGRTDAT